MNDNKRFRPAPGATPTRGPAHARERDEPDERQRPLPWFVIMLIGAMAMWGVFYIYDMKSGLDSQYGDSRTPSALMPPAPADAASGIKAVMDGGQIYTTKCAACHQTTGLGIAGVFPPLAGSEWVTGSDKVLVQIPLHGITGTLQVAGTTYNGAMPAFNTLSDEEIAAVLSYVRSQWGNAAPAVSPETVQAGREATKARRLPYVNGDEIKRAAGS